MVATDRFVIGAYWAFRETTCELAIGQFCAWLATVSKCDDRTATWYLKAKTKEAALQAPLINGGVVDQQVSNTLNRKMVSNPYGAVIGVWNGRDGADALDVTFACELKDSPAKLMNSLAVASAFGNPQPSWMTLDLGVSVLGSMVDIFGPDWAVATSGSLRELMKTGPNAPVVGWITYRSHAMRMPTASPIGEADTDFRGRGVLIKLGDKPLSSSSSSDIEQLRSLAVALDSQASQIGKGE